MSPAKPKKTAAEAPARPSPAKARATAPLNTAKPAWA